MEIQFASRFCVHVAQIHIQERLNQRSESNSQQKWHQNNHSSRWNSFGRSTWPLLIQGTVVGVQLLRAVVEPRASVGVRRPCFKLHRQAVGAVFETERRCPLAVTQLPTTAVPLCVRSACDVVRGVSRAMVAAAPANLSEPVHKVRSADSVVLARFVPFVAEACANGNAANCVRLVRVLPALNVRVTLVEATLHLFTNICKKGVTYNNMTMAWEWWCQRNSHATC